MRRVLGTLAVCLLFGCRSQSTTLSNPFLAPDRVPPPATRNLQPGTAQPYYPGDPMPGSPNVTPTPSYAPGPTTPAEPTYSPSPDSPQPGGTTIPPGGWNSYPQNSGASNNVVPRGNQLVLGPTDESPVQIAADEQSLRFGAPTSPLFKNSSSPGYVSPQPATASHAGAVVDNSVLPTPAGATGPASYPGQLVQYEQAAAPVGQQVMPEGARSVSIREVSADEVNDSPTVRNDGFRPQGSGQRTRRGDEVIRPAQALATSSESPERFGFDPNYSWLRGKLEYSEATDQWKLRYIPIQGNTDQFGGSVLIANPQVLGNLQHGDHVLLRGRLEQQQFDSHSYAPLYTVSVVQRQQI